MAKLPETFTFGNIDNIEELLERLNRMYIDLATAINQKADFVQRAANGQTTDVFLSNGTLNLNTSTQKVEMLTKHIDSSTVNWTTLS